MKPFAILLSFCLLIFSGCASIMSKSYYPVDINSVPSKADITIYNKKGDTVYSGTTPAYVRLKAGGFFFSPQNYVVRFDKEGYRTLDMHITSELDAWYSTNIFLIYLAIPGALIIDPATGAMYKLNERNVQGVLEPVLPTETGRHNH